MFECSTKKVEGDMNNCPVELESNCVATAEQFLKMIDLRFGL